jgi:hypothetical protein
MQKVYRCGEPPLVQYCRETDVGWKEAVFCVTECAREKYSVRLLTKAVLSVRQQVDAAVS